MLTRQIHRHLRAGLALLALTAGATACDLDLANPNAPSREEALSTANGVMGLAVGLQELYSSNVLVFIRAPALVTDEWGPARRSLFADQSLFTGEGIDRSFGVVSGPYAAGFRVISLANNLIDAAPRVGLSPGTRAGITALAKLFKAMALGTLITQYETIPTDVDAAGAPLKERRVVYAEIMKILESARADLAGNNASLTEFNRRVLGDRFDLVATIDAMLARYSLFAAAEETTATESQRLYQQAIAAADRVNLTKVSVFTYPAPDVNPIYAYSLQLIYIAPLLDWVREAEPGDRRPEFWVNTAAAPVAGVPTTVRLLPLRQYSVRNDPFPVYIPDEMQLIKAEAWARLGRLDLAIQFINAVRTQSPTKLDPREETEPKAGLPPLDPARLNTLAAVLNQVAYERKYELYEQGLRWPDMRRLDPYITEEPVIRWLPLPQQECLANPQVNC